MLRVHVVTADHLVSDHLCRGTLAGNAPKVISARELGVGDCRAVVGLARMNAMCARTPAAWLRAYGGVKNIALNRQPARVEACEMPFGPSKGNYEGATG